MNDTPPLLAFEGMIGFGAQEAEDAAHFFEHTLGLPLSAEEGGIRFYQLADGLTAMVDATGELAGAAPYLVFSTPDLTAAAEHFLQRGCALRELPWGPGFLARAPEGHAVAVVDEGALDEPE